MDVIGANGCHRREPSDDVDVEELGKSSSNRPETDHGVMRDVMLVVLRQFSHRPLLQPRVQPSIARTRRGRLRVETGRDQRPGKLGRGRERVTHGQGGDFFVFRESWIGTQPEPERTLVGGVTGLTYKCKRNRLHGLHYGGY
jgi:hypothetical protein